MPKVSRKSISLELKLKVLRLMESVLVPSWLGEFGFRESESTIVKNKVKKIKVSNQSMAPIGVTKLMRSQSSLMEKMERLFSSWTDDTTQCTTPYARE